MKWQIVVLVEMFSNPEQNPRGDYKKVVQKYSLHELYFESNHGQFAEGLH